MKTTVLGKTGFLATCLLFGVAGSLHAQNIYKCTQGGKLEFTDHPCPGKAGELIHQAELIPHGEIVRFVCERNLHGRGVGWIDIHLLAAAIVGHMRVWTADANFSAMARELDIAYQGPPSKSGPQLL